MTWDKAYCAPGRKVTAGIALMLHDEQADEIVEHPWLAGMSSVILIRESGLEFPLPPFTLEKDG